MAASLAFGLTPAGSGLAAGDDFETLFLQAAADPEALAGARTEREGQEVASDLRGDETYMRSFRAFAPRIAASTVKISQKAEDLIVLFEVSNATTYDRLYQRPAWPGGASGVTIGVGYDLSFIRPEWLQEDWGPYLDAVTIKRLEGACRLKGAGAKLFCERNKDLRIPWRLAHPQFQFVLLPRFIAQTLLALPKAETFAEDALGALVSLTYNRGASYRKNGSRYLEMRQIYLATESGRAEAIPGYIRNMVHLWEGQPGLRGLVTRRRLEAALYERANGTKT